MIYLDLETTGLPHDQEGKALTKHHLILEIGMLAINMPEMTEVDAWSTAIRTPKHQILERADDYVLKMHTKNGLFGEIAKDGESMLRVEAGGLPILAQAEQMALQFLARNADPTEKPELCGAGPEFDRSFLLAQMTKLHNAFHYRNFDTNAFWLTQKFMNDWDGIKGQQPHRALPDCRREFQAFLDHFTWVGEVMRGVR
jgi:oligoribonuclease (3'-5' exoribonuclease)